MDHCSSRSSGATAREVTTSNVRSSVQRVGPTAHHLDVGQRQRVDDLLEEGRPAQQRLHQRHPEVGTRDGEHQARAAPPRSRCRRPWHPAAPPRPGRRSSAGAGPRAGAPPEGRSGPGPRPRWPAGRRTPPPAAGGRTRTPSRPRRRGGCAVVRRSRRSFHVKQADRRSDQAGRMTTYRLGSAPSDSEVRPAAATASCTTLRSNGRHRRQRHRLARLLHLARSSRRPAPRGVARCSAR